MAQLTPQEAVLVEFLRYLSETIHSQEPVILVLRGSMLMRHWFGARARIAADIDLECFERVQGGRGNRFTSLVDHARGLCCFGTEVAWSYRGAAQYVQFDEIDAPEDGQSLWTYGSPGQRFYAGWTLHGPENQIGRIQIDIAESRSYGLYEISVADVLFASIDGGTFTFPSYTPEMMLAAKLSWLLRSFRRRLTDRGVSAPEWQGELKDLFDVHLLLTKPNLHADVFQKSLLAVGTEDQLEWNNLEALFDVRRTKVTDADFPNWSEFQERHNTIVTAGPTEMLQTIVDGLEPLLGDFYLREEMPFLLSINADPVDETNYLIYSDWLEDRDEQRGQFLRHFTTLFFRANELSPGDLARTRKTLQTALRGTSTPWLLQLFGTSARFAEFRHRIASNSL